VAGPGGNVHVWNGLRYSRFAGAVQSMTSSGKRYELTRKARHLDVFGDVLKGLLFIAIIWFAIRTYLNQDPPNYDQVFITGLILALLSPLILLRLVIFLGSDANTSLLTLMKRSVRHMQRPADRGKEPGHLPCQVRPSRLSCSPTPAFGFASRPRSVHLPQGRHFRDRETLALEENDLGGLRLRPSFDC